MLVTAAEAAPELKWLAPSALLLCACAQAPVSAAAPTAATSRAAIAAPAPTTGHNLLRASEFNDGQSAPWAVWFTAPAVGSADVEAGAYCITIENAGSKPWDAQLRHRELVIQRRHSYTLQFKAWASAPSKARPKIGMSGPPYAEYWSSPLDLSTVPQVYIGKFTMQRPDDASAELAFHLGGAMATAPVPFKVCIDEVRLDDPEFSEPLLSRTAATQPPAWQLADHLDEKSGASRSTHAAIGVDSRAPRHLQSTKP